MLKNYMHPAEMPEIFLDDNGIVHILFGTILLTVEHMVFSIAIVRKLASGKKLPIVIVSEAALNIQNNFSELAHSKWITDVTAAVALVTNTKLGQVLGNIFMSLQSNPYPTKMFTDKEDALEWLIQYRSS